MRVPDKLAFNDQDTYLKDDGTSLKLYVNNMKVMTTESDGGIMHGSWMSEASLITSDRRMKKEIVPLQRTLRNIIPVTPQEAQERRTKASDLAKGAGGDGAQWLLRQLRPVSYSFRKGAESKYMRFGFIADELESVVPQVVRTTGGGEVKDKKAIVYQDLIALLTAATQIQEQQLDTQSKLLEEVKKTFIKTRKALDTLKEMKKQRKEKERLQRARARLWKQHEKLRERCAGNQQHI